MRLTATNADETNVMTASGITVVMASAVTVLLNRANGTTSETAAMGVANGSATATGAIATAARETGLASGETSGAMDGSPAPAVCQGRRLTRTGSNSQAAVTAAAAAAVAGEAAVSALMMTAWAARMTRSWRR